MKGRPTSLARMEGHFSDRPLAEIISEILSARLSGALRLSRERERAAVYFEEGRVVAALSNLRAHRLAEFARRAGLVGDEQLRELTAAGQPDEKIASELVGAGAVTDEGLRDLLTAQSAEVLQHLLKWDEGSWEFDPRVRLAARHKAETEAGRFLVEHVRELPAESLAALMSESEPLLPPLKVLDDETLMRLGLSPSEAFVFTRVTGRTTLGELLLVGGLPEAETRRAAYALALTGMLERPARAATFTPEALRKAASAARPEQAVAAGEGGAGPASEPAAASSAEAERPAAEARPDDSRSAMEELLELGRKETHYEVLGVLRTAKPEEIKRAYLSIARRLHPDRFRRDAEGEFVRQLDISFARVTQAYEILKDSSLRATYDMKLAAQPAQSAASRNHVGARSVSERGGGGGGGGAGPEREPAADASPQSHNAEEKFQRGLSALREGNLATARRLLGEAALIAPRQARYRAYYGRELARDRATRRQAEAELQAAVALDESNPSYRVMLAELYLDAGLRKRAEGEILRALEIAPGHDAAMRLLKRLDTSG